jgi:hypothetical protein
MEVEYPLEEGALELLQDVDADAAQETLRIIDPTM